MCAVEPIPLMLEPMKDPKMVLLVSEARKAQGVHNYIKDVCIHSPAVVWSILRQFYQTTILKATAVNYVLEDNPEFRFRASDEVYSEVNMVLKNGNLVVDFKTTSNGSPDSAQIKPNITFPLKKGDYIVASMSCKMVQPAPCDVYYTCTAMGKFQFEFNGVQLPGEIPAMFMSLHTMFGIMEIDGLGERTSARELHLLYNDITDSFAVGKLEITYGVRYLQLRARNGYLWAGDWAVIAGRFMNMNALYEGIAVGVTINGSDEGDMKDFVRYKDYIGEATFHISVGVNATIINCEEEVQVCTKITAGTRCLIPTLHNINMDNVETHVMTWANDEW